MITTKKIVLGVMAFIVLIIILGSFGTVSTGEIGIKTRLSKVIGTVQPGFYVKTPFFDSVIPMDVQIQKEQVDSSAASKDLQIVNAKVAINYSVDSNKAQDLYSRVGEDYKTRVIDPAIQEVVKAVTALYTAEELITKRPDVTVKIQSGLSERLQAFDISVSSVSITNFDFSPTFNQAIEAKVTAEQQALQAKNRLDQVKYEAEQTITKAKAQAESIQIQAQAIQQQGGANYVQLQAIEKWDGKLPTQMIPGATVPFLNLTK